MELKLYLDTEISESYIAQEIYNSANFFTKICPALGGKAVETFLNEFISVKSSGLLSSNINEQRTFLKDFNNKADNLKSIHLVGTSETISCGRARAITVGNIALVSVLSYSEKQIWQPVIHELGHTMGLVQPQMRNYFADSNELAGGEPGNHCFGPFCIMSVRNIDPEHQVGRYADYKTNPNSVFCSDCQNHLKTAEVQELPWYNQIKSF